MSDLTRDEKLVIAAAVPVFGREFLSLVGTTITMGHAGFHGLYVPYLPEDDIGSAAGKFMRRFLVDGARAVDSEFTWLVQRWLALAFEPAPPPPPESKPPR